MRKHSKAMPKLLSPTLTRRLCLHLQSRKVRWAYCSFTVVALSLGLTHLSFVLLRKTASLR